MLTPQPGVERNPFDELVLGGGAGREEEEVAIEEEVEQEKSECSSSEEQSNDVTGRQQGTQGGVLTGRGTGDAAETQSMRRRAKLSWRERMRHFTWTWVSIATVNGGERTGLMASSSAQRWRRAGLPTSCMQVRVFLNLDQIPCTELMFHAVPFRFRGIYTIGCVFFLFNMCLFLFTVALISLRFYLYPRTFRASVLHPTESLFIPASIVSFGIIMMNISQYGVGMAGVGRWLERCMVVLFWADCGLAVAMSLGIYLVM